MLFDTGYKEVWKEVESLTLMVLDGVISINLRDHVIDIELYCHCNSKESYSLFGRDQISIVADRASYCYECPIETLQL